MGDTPSLPLLFVQTIQLTLNIFNTCAVIITCSCIMHTSFPPPVQL